MTPRRARVLRILASLWLLMGVVVAVSDSAIDPGDAIAYEALPIWLRTAMWVSTALVALAASYRIRWQDWGWWALAIMPAERALSHAWSVLHSLSHAWSVLHSLIPSHPPGTTAEGVASLLLWVGITHLVLTLAGWDEDTVREDRAH